MQVLSSFSLFLFCNLFNLVTGAEGILPCCGTEGSGDGGLRTAPGALRQDNQVRLVSEVVSKKIFPHVTLIGSSSL